MTAPKASVAVLGGGLSGLSAAYHLARRHPDALITVYEKETRFGGWVRSERVLVEDEDGNKASVLLEAAPRTLRPNAKSVLELINLLELKDQVLTTHRSSAAARSRFLSLPDANGLSALPSSLWSLLTTRLGLLILRSVLIEPFWPANRPPHVTDESVDAFFTRRFGETFARTLGSALVHGIYAADSRQLSVRAAFPSLWEAEDRGAGSVLMGELGPRAWWSASRRARKARAKEEAEGWELGDDPAFEKLLKGAALISFSDGMETLVKALVATLDGLPNVTLRTGCRIASLGQQSDFSITLRTTDGTVTHTHVVSALPLPSLASILPPAKSLPHLNVNPSQTVAVMNFVIPVARLSRPVHPPGFGFLVPRPIAGYPDPRRSEEPGMLGAVFDTSSLAAQDHALSQSLSAKSSAPQFVKLTAMIGGPFGVAQPPLMDVVLSQVSSRLGTVIPRPVLTRLHVHAGSIPTYRVGHLDRLAEIRVSCDKLWNGRMKVIGAGVSGVSVGDCIKSGRDVSRQIVF